MSRNVRLVVLGALGLGVFLVGVELMVTAVALPQILATLTDWTQLRHASWIINGYLVAYVAVMPLAGRAADRYNLGLLYGASLVAFSLGSFAAGSAPSLDGLIVARVVQGAGAGAIFPLATAAAGHLFAGHARARAIGLVSALSFLGMAAGPFIGATILEVFSASSGLPGPPWRWVFYLSAPFALLAAIYVWAAGRDWPRPVGTGRLDLVGGGIFTVGIAMGLLAISSVGSDGAVDPRASGIVAVVLVVVSLLIFARSHDPFIDLRHFRDRTFSGAIAMCLLTGYALATAIVGAAVFVDRVRYAGAAEQQLALGSLAGAMAIGALGSGYLVRPFGVMVPSVAGLVAEVIGLLIVSTATPTTDLLVLCSGLALFGAGFGVTVTARTTGALEALGRRAFGVSSAALTVARMIGMGVGLAVLTALGSNRILALSSVLTDPGARDAVLPAALRGRPLQDYLVVDALERWAADQAAGILATLFVVAAIVTALAILPTLAMRNRPRAEDAVAQEEETLGEVEQAPQSPAII